MSLGNIGNKALITHMKNIIYIILILQTAHSIDLVLEEALSLEFNKNQFSIANYTYFSAIFKNRIETGWNKIEFW